MLGECSPPTMCHMSGVRCQMLCVRCQVQIFFYKVVEQIRGGSVINGANPVYTQARFHDKINYYMSIETPNFQGGFKPYHKQDSLLTLVCPPFQGCQLMLTLESRNILAVRKHGFTFFLQSQLHAAINALVILKLDKLPDPVQPGQFCKQQFN